MLASSAGLLAGGIVGAGAQAADAQPKGSLCSLYVDPVMASSGNTLSTWAKAHCWSPYYPYHFYVQIQASPHGKNSWSYYTASAQWDDQGGHTLSKSMSCLHGNYDYRAYALIQDNNPYVGNYDNWMSAPINVSCK